MNKWQVAGSLKIELRTNDTTCYKDIKIRANAIIPWSQIREIELNCMRKTNGWQEHHTIEVTALGLIDEDAGWINNKPGTYKVWVPKHIKKHQSAMQIAYIMTSLLPKTRGKT